jgi:hypothetical protein
LIFGFWGTLYISHEKYIKDGKILAHLGFKLKVFPGSLTDLSDQSWYLTPCCGLEMHYTTKALKSVKGPGNTFDLKPKWQRTLQFFGNCLWDVYRVPPPYPNIKVDI